MSCVEVLQNRMGGRWPQTRLPLGGPQDAWSSRQAPFGCPRKSCAMTSAGDVHELGVGVCNGSGARVGRVRSPRTLQPAVDAERARARQGYAMDCRHNEAKEMWIDGEKNRRPGFWTGGRIESLTVECDDGAEAGLYLLRHTSWLGTQVRTSIIQVLGTLQLQLTCLLRGDWLLYRRKEGREVALAWWLDKRSSSSSSSSHLPLPASCCRCRSLCVCSQTKRDRPEARTLVAKASAACLTWPAAVPFFWLCGRLRPDRPHPVELFKVGCRLPYLCPGLIALLALALADRADRAAI